MGYARAGFEVVGVDIEPRPRYPFSFVQADALTFPLEGFDVVHASPPCQLYSPTYHLWKREHPNLVPALRARLLQWGGQWVMENVPQAPMQHGVILCGSMFGLRVRRHRCFESSLLLFAPGPCHHKGQVKQQGKKTGEVITVAGHDFTIAEAQRAMGIDWMSQYGLAQAIPPAYTEWIGRQVLDVLARRAVYA